MNILLIDDDADIRTTLTQFIRKLGHRVVSAVDGKDGFDKFVQQAFDLVITDIRMPNTDGIDLLRKIRKSRVQPAEVIIITGHGDVDNAIDALKLGAYSYLKKPIDVRELAIIIQRCEDLTRLRNKYLDLKSHFDEQIHDKVCHLDIATDLFKSAYLQEVGLDSLKYCSAEMNKVIELAEQFSKDRNIPVLIEGESGTGKELIARLIHYFAMNADTQPFVAINCGAIAPELFEGELFGHVSGAYTSASKKGRAGKIAAADGGTLFLDEIGELLPAMQVKLLRVLEERKYYPVGGDREVSVDIRLLSATNQKLEHAVSKGKFRLDLYHRLNVGRIVIPPLRERKSDILMLANHFIRMACNRYGKRFDQFTPRAEKMLKDHPWPGNVRQLKNAMSRLGLLTPDGCLDADDLSFIKEGPVPDDPEYQPNGVLSAGSFDLPPDEFNLDAFTKEIIKKALKLNKNNQTRTAAYLGISRRVLQGRLNKMRPSR